jgi:integrase/recombinase XerD
MVSSGAARSSQLTECEVPWPEDVGATKPLPQDQEHSDERESAHQPAACGMIEDMNVRNFRDKTQDDYIRHVKSFSTFLGRSPTTATPEDLRQYQVHQSKAGAQPPTINSAVSALRFFFRVTLNRPEMCRYMTMVRQAQKLPTVLSKEEVVQLLEAAPVTGFERRPLP